MMSRFALKLFGLLIFALAAPASAVPITWVFTASVTSSNGLGTGTATTATTLSGSFTYESTTPDANVANANLGVYGAGLSAFALQIGSDSIVLGPTGLDVLDDFALVTGTVDALDVMGFGGTLNGVPTPSAFVQAIIGTMDLSLYSSDALPLGPEPVSATYGGDVFGNVVDASGNGYFFLANITSLALPEPMSGGLLCVAAILIGSRRRT